MNGVSAAKYTKNSRRLSRTRAYIYTQSWKTWRPEHVRSYLRADVAAGARNCTSAKSRNSPPSVG
ncbi:unnamed protein product [Ixodes pacificus]